MALLITQFSPLPYNPNDIGAMECLLLSLPRSSKSPELVQLLREHAFQPSSPEDSDELRGKREETAKECLKYIEVSHNTLRAFYMSCFWTLAHRTISAAV